MAVYAVYTLDELAALWKVSTQTIDNWLEWEREAGRGPTLKQLVVKLAKGRVGPKVRVIRADYASKIQDRYVFRVFARRHRSTVRGTEIRLPFVLAGKSGQKLSP